MDYNKLINLIMNYKQLLWIINLINLIKNYKQLLWIITNL